jgi:hypothetical protein
MRICRYVKFFVGTDLFKPQFASESPVDALYMIT